jgi:CHASE2 domain-containing sensor protein
MPDESQISMSRISSWHIGAFLKKLFGGTSARSRAAVALICALSCGFMSLHVLHFESRDDVDRQVWNALPFWSALERNEYALLDQRFAHRGVRQPRSLDSIAIVAIDGTSVDALKQWPWPRRYHAQLVTRLKKAGARVVVLDIGFNDYSGAIRNAQTGEVKLSTDDQMLADAMESAGNVVLVSHLDPQKVRVEGAAQSQMSRLATPIEELDVLTPDLAVNYVRRDTDGGSRLYPIRIRKPPEIAPLGGIAPLSVAMFQGLVKDGNLERYHDILRSGEWPDLRQIARRIPLKRGDLPGSANSQDNTQVWTTPLHYWGPQGTFPTYSYSNVVDERQWSDAKLKNHFANRLVMVGATYHVLKDVFPAPNFGSGGSAELPGVEVHATMAAMLFDGTYLRTQSTKSTLWTLLGLTIAASAWTALLCHRSSIIARRAQAWWAQKKLPGRVHSPLWIGMCVLFGPLPVCALLDGRAMGVFQLQPVDNRDLSGAWRGARVGRDAFAFVRWRKRGAAQNAHANVAHRGARRDG